jgi:hypothetical protein
MEIEPTGIEVAEEGNEVVDSEQLTGSEELAILAGGLCIFYGGLDFFASLFGVLFPGGYYSPTIFILLGSGIIYYKSKWNAFPLQPFSQSPKTKKIMGGVLGTSLLFILIIFLFSIADDEIVGTWSNPVQTFTFNSDGSLDDSTGDWSEWRVDGETLFLVDPNEPEFEYMFRYTISGEMLFLAPMETDNSVVSEDCSAYAIQSVNWDDAKYDEWPSWCTEE